MDRQQILGSATRHQVWCDLMTDSDAFRDGGPTNGVNGHADRSTPLVIKTSTLLSIPNPKAHMDSTPVFFDRITLNEVYDAHAIETLGYPADETDTLDTFLYRHTHAPDLFVGAFVPSAHSSSGRTLVGFITGTRTVSPTFTKASMYTHAPGGSSVCVQSLCVAPSFRRKYIGRGLWRRFLSWVEETSYERVILIAHRELVPFYKKVGFGVVGLSSIIYGSKPWFEMCKYRKDRLPRVELVPQVASMIAYRPNPPYHDSHPSPQSPSSDYNGDNDVEPVGLSKGRTPVIAYSVPKFSEVIVAGR